MNFKKLLGSLGVILGGVALALAHNIDAILAKPGTIIGIILSAVGGMVLTHDAGVTNGAQQQANATKTPNLIQGGP